MVPAVIVVAESVELNMANVLESLTLNDIATNKEDD